MSACDFVTKKCVSFVARVLFLCFYEVLCVLLFGTAQKMKAEETGCCLGAQRKEKKMRQNKNIK